MSPAGAAEVLERLYPTLLQSLENGAGGPFVAAILLDGGVVGRGTNTVLRDRDVTRHAEMNALSEAGRATGRIHLPGASLVTSHFPCLMCYHAAKWAGIREVWYLFDYEETERIFGFHGDARFLAELGLRSGPVAPDPSLRLTRIAGERVEALYRGELARLWVKRFRDDLGGYDVGGPATGRSVS